jgi:hypothetical protein
MSPLIKPLNATSVGSLISGAPGPKNVVGMTLIGALRSGNQQLLMTSLGRGNQMPNGGIDAGQNDVDTNSQSGGDDDEQ